MGDTKFAVIGAGIAGLSAAWLLGRRNDVTVFEANATPGGHANTVTVCLPLGKRALDTGFIVYNPPSYPNLTALFEHLQVETQPAPMGFSVSLEGGCEYSGSGLHNLVGNWQQGLDGAHWRLIADILRFFETAEKRAETLADNVTLGAFLAGEGYSESFIERHILPMAGAIWSAEPERLKHYPAKSFIQFFANHGLLKLTRRPQWRTVSGGSVHYVRKICGSGRFTLRSGAAVRQVQRGTNGVQVVLADGKSQFFDHAVLAVHADTALRLIAADADDLEMRVLGQFSYTRNRAVLHSDKRLMPARRRLWSGWNFLGTVDGRISVSYWMNHLQSLPKEFPLFVTLNPGRAIDRRLVHASFDYDHPLLDLAAFQAQKHLWSLQGRHRTWFCGAYFGAGFHEDALQSGLAVAEQLGGERRPWTVANPSGRIRIGLHDVNQGMHFREAAE